MVKDFADLGQIPQPQAKQVAEYQDLVDAGYLSENITQGYYYYYLTIKGAGILDTSMAQQGIERS